MNAGAATARSMLVLLVVCALQACAGSGTRSNADSTDAHLNLGIAYLRQGRPEVALENLQRAVERSPRNAEAHNAIALAHAQLGNDEDAEEHYRRAARLDPADPGIANGYAVFLCRQGRWSDAERYFRRAADNPSYTTPAAALTNAGVCARRAGALDEAEEYLREALSRNEAYPDALEAMTELAYRQGNALQARAFMQRYLEAGEPNASVLLLCVNIERELDDRDAADRCARRLRDEFPESAELAELRQMESDAR